MVQSQVVTQVEATVQLEFESWGKLQLALAAGFAADESIADCERGGTANGSGGVAASCSTQLVGWVYVELR